MPRKPIPAFDLNAFSVRFRAESDRACAVLGAAMLDARLESLFLRRLRCFKDELLSSMGPIGTFSARIRIARALAWISADVQHDLDTIRSIRNEFAHSFDHELSFGNQSIATKCGMLRTAGTLIKGHEIAASRPHKNLSSHVIREMGKIFLPSRSRYEVSVELIAQHLDEIPGQENDYSGPDFLTEVEGLGSNINIRISATGTVGPAPPKDDGGGTSSGSDHAK